MNVRGATLFWRLAAGMTLVTVLAVLCGSFFLFVRFEGANENFREDTLLSFADATRHALEQRDNALLDSLLQRIRDLHGQYSIITESGNPLRNSTRESYGLMPADNTDKRYFVLPAHQGFSRLFGISLRLSSFKPPLFVQVAFPRGSIVFDSVLEEFVRDIAWIWIPFVLVLLATNVVIAKLALQPLSRAAQEAEAIEPASINTRLTEGDLPSDVLVLVQSINKALARLQSGYLALERFSENIAHELRTPIAIMKARLAISDAALARELEDDIGSMERLVGQLIDRARVGGLHIEENDIVDLRKVASTVCTFLAPVIVANGRLIEVINPQTAVEVRGVTDFLFRALRNLIENAVEHSPPGATVTVEVWKNGSIEVLDCGHGFPESKLDPALRKVERLTSDRSEGLGLGLSIVDETMAAHGGRLVLRNRPGGGGWALMSFPCLDAQNPRPAAIL
jgi:signal transduction histidine kinase